MSDSPVRYGLSPAWLKPHLIASETGVPKAKCGLVLDCFISGEEAERDWEEFGCKRCKRP